MTLGLFGIVSSTSEFFLKFLVVLLSAVILGGFRVDVFNFLLSATTLFFVVGLLVRSLALANFEGLLIF